MAELSTDGAFIEGGWFSRNFNEFPCLFHSTRALELSNSRLHHLKLRNKSPEDDVIWQEASRTTESNLQVFILWTLHDREQAMEEAKLAVSKYPSSIIARANLAYISWKCGDLERAEEQLKTLKELQNGPDDLCLQSLEQAMEELIYCYSQMGYEVIHETITSAERAMQKWPSNSRFKLSLAVALRRTLNITYKILHPEMDFVRVLQRAVDYLVELKENVATDTRTRALAYAELGDILAFQYDSELDDNVKKITRSLDIQAGDCFEIALDLDGDDPGLLRRAGKYFRNVRDYVRSCQLLYRATELRPSSINHHNLGLTLKKLAVEEKLLEQLNGDRKTSLVGSDNRLNAKCVSSTISYQGDKYHRNTSRRANDRSDERVDVLNCERNMRKLDDLSGQSALISGEKALEINLRPNNAASDFPSLYKCAQKARGTTSPTGRSAIERASRSERLKWVFKSPPRNKRLSLSDKYVKESLENFQKAVEVSDCDNQRAVFDLGLMYRSLGECNLALDEFHRILKINYDIPESVSAFEQSGLVYLEMSDSATDEQRRDFKQMSQVMLLMAVICQSAVIDRNRVFEKHSTKIWSDFFNLSEYIRRLQQGFALSPGKANAMEDWLLELLKRHCTHLPIVQDILNFNSSEAGNIKTMESKLRRYDHEGRYEDAMTFLALLKLTSHRQAMSNFRIPDFELRVNILAARNRLLHIVKDKDTLKNVNFSNSQVARCIFRWALEKRFATLQSRKTASRPFLHEDLNTFANIEEESVHNSCGPLKKELSLETMTNEKRIATTNTNVSIGHPAFELSQECFSMEVCHVVLLHDLTDKIRAESVASLEHLMQEAYGLMVKRLTGSHLKHDPSALARVLDNACLVVVVIADKDISIEFKECITTAISRSESFDPNALRASARLPSMIALNILSLSVNGSPIPSLLGEHRVLPCPQDVLQYHVDMLKSQEGVDAICKFFVQLLGIDFDFI